MAKASENFVAAGSPVQILPCNKTKSAPRKSSFLALDDPSGKGWLPAPDVVDDITDPVVKVTAMARRNTPNLLRILILINILLLLYRAASRGREPRAIKRS